MTCLGSRLCRLKIQSLGSKKQQIYFYSIFAAVKGPVLQNSSGKLPLNLRQTLKLSIPSPQNHQYMMGTFKTIHLTSNLRFKSMPKVQVSLIKIGTPIQFGPNMALFWPNLVQLTHFVTGVGSSNLTYALTVVINFRNVL